MPQSIWKKIKNCIESHHLETVINADLFLCFYEKQADKQKKTQSKQTLELNEEFEYK